jgi:hypothetical protein
MNQNPERDNAGLQSGEVVKAINLNPKRIKKIDRVEAALKEPHGLNRFEAERIGEHCLNSTVAVLREMYGDKLIQQWETVPTRYCETGVRVYRYWLISEQEAA